MNDMKTMKKVLALLVAVLMIAVSMSALADETYQNKLKVTGLEKDDVAHFYQIVKWVGDVTPAAGDVVVNGWQVLDAYKTVLTESVFKTAFVGTPAKDAVGTEGEEGYQAAVAKVDPTGITSELAGKLALAAKNETSVDVTVGDTKEAEFDNTVAGRGAGLYMAVITPADPDYIYNPVFVASNFKTGANSQEALTSVSYGDNSAVKKSKTELKKTADTKPENEWDDQNKGNTEFYWTTTAIGDTVDFSVSTTIPGYGDVYESPVFILTDTMEALTLKQDSVTLTAPTGLVKYTEGATTWDYKVTTAETNYKVEFSSTYLKTVKEPTAVTVTYKAIVNTDAPLNINREKNTVSTEYSHNPSDASDHGFKKDTTQHYTFTIDAEGTGDGSKTYGKKTSEIVKVGLDEQGNPIKTTTQTSEITGTEKWEGPLAGAKFKLYTDAECKNEYVPKLKGTGEAGTALSIESGSDGRFTIPGLDAGKYYLQETEAPAGYVRDTRIVPIEISTTTQKVNVTEYTTDGATWISQADYNEKSDTEKAAYKSYTYETEVLKSYTVKVNGQNTATYKFNNKGSEAEMIWEGDDKPVEKPFPFTNNKGVELPSTGGIGTTLFYIGGSILVLAAVILLVTKRRMGSDE